MPAKALMPATVWMQAIAVTQATTVTPATSNIKDDSNIMTAHNRRLRKQQQECKSQKDRQHSMDTKQLMSFRGNSLKSPQNDEKFMKKDVKKIKNSPFFVRQISVIPIAIRLKSNVDSPIVKV
jgi:hypothetical protein